MASVPTGLGLTVASYSQINAAWTYHGPYDSLTLWWKVDGGTYASVSLPTSATYYNKTGLTDGKKYYFHVSVTWDAGTDGDSTSDVSAVTTLRAPTGLGATPAGTTVDLAWTDNSSSESAYRVYRGSTLIATLAAGVTSYEVTGLNHSTSYTFYVCAYNAAYGESTRASVSTTTTAAPPPPGVPTSIAAAAQGTTSNKITWTKYSTAERTYVYWSADNVTYTLLGYVPSSATQEYTHSSLTYNTLYYYRLRSWNSTGGLSSYSSAVSETTDDHSAYVILDLGAGNDRAINRVSFKTAADNFNGFTIHGKIGAGSYVLLYTGNAANSSALQTFDFTNTTSYRYIKLTNTSNHAHNAMKIYTFNAYEIPYTGEWLKLDCGSGVTKTPVRVIIRPKSSGIKDWELSGSDDDSTYTPLVSGRCVSGDSENEVTFTNSTAYRYFKLLVTSAYSTANIAAADFKLYELATITDQNYYIFHHDTTGHILRRVLFPDIDSMVAFIAAWETEKPSWDHAAWTVPMSDVSVANDTVTITGHGLKENDMIAYSKVIDPADPIGGLSDFGNYYIRDVTANTFKFSLTRGGAVIDLLSQGNDGQKIAPFTYAMGGCTFDDFFDNADIAEKITADGYTVTEATLDALIQETISSLSLVALLSASKMFGIPDAYAESLPSTGITSIHELKRRDLKQEFVSGAWQEASPNEYIQNKFRFMTASSNLYLANLDENGDITGFELLETGLKTGTEPSWANYGNRAFMVNGSEDDCDNIWTDGDGVYLNGIVPPVVLENGAVSTLAQTDFDTTEDTITITAHGFYNQQRVVYANGSGADAGGLVDGTTYYVIVVDVDTIKLSATAGGSAIDITSDGTTDDQTLTTSSITQAISGGFMSDGDYYIKIKYYRSTYDGNSSLPSSEISYSLSGGGDTQKIILDVPRSSDPQVEYIKVYRTKIGDAIFYKATEVANVAVDNTVTQVALTLADNSLDVMDLEEDNDPAPNCKIILAFKGINRMGYLRDDGMYFSEAGHPENVPLANYIPFGKDDGQFLTGARVVGDWCFVGKEDSIYVVDLNNITQLESICLSSILGVVDWKSLVEIEDGQALMWASKLGFCISDGVSIKNLSRGKSVIGDAGDDEIGGTNFNDFVNNFDFTRKKECCAMFLPKRQLYICMTPYKGTDEYGFENYRIWCYDIVKGSFFKWSFPIPPQRLFTLDDDNGIPRLVSTFTQIHKDEYYGYVMLLDDESAYTDTVSITFAGAETKQNVSWDFATCWTNLGLAERIKLMRMLFAQIYATGPVTINVTVGIDHKRYLRGQLTEISFHTGVFSHEGETGTTPGEGDDAIEGFDYGRVKTFGIPVDAVGTDFSLRLDCSDAEKVVLLEFVEMFRLRGGRPNP